MAEAPIHQPNDKLLNATSSVPANSRGFFKNHLPPRTRRRFRLALPRPRTLHLRPCQPTLAYHLLELVRIPYDTIAGTPEGILTLRAYADGVREAIDALENPNRLQNLLESAIRSGSIEAFAQNL